MNSSDSPQPRRTRWCRCLKWYGLAMGLSALVLGLAAWDAITLSRDARVLRDVITRRSGGTLRTTIQISASEPLLALAQGCLHYIHDVPAEARMALGAVKRASVGVYTLSAPLSGAAAAGVLTGTGTEMSRRGWTRAVAVIDGKQCVSIFVRASRWSETTQDVCLSVCDDRQVVVISGRADAAALAQLVHERVGAARL